jgi:hypothetical protein
MTKSASLILVHSKQNTSHKSSRETLFVLGVTSWSLTPDEQVKPEKVEVY